MIYDSVITNPANNNIIIIITTFLEYLIYARLCAMHLTFSDPLILLMIPQSRLHYLLHFIIENETEEQRFRNVCPLAIQ